jgi:hypothetical protein
MASAAGPAQSKHIRLRYQKPTFPWKSKSVECAHEIWLQRGGQDGSDTEDWLQAEEEILNGG